MASLPDPSPDQAYCLVSALHTGSIDLPLDFLISTAEPGSRATIPCLSFLLRHSKTHTTLVFDLGTRKDLSTLTPAYRARIEEMTFRCSVPEDAADAVRKGGLAPEDVDYVCLSHLHFDHIGDPAPFARATVLAGAGARPLVEAGYPHDPASLFDARLLPPSRTRWLDPEDPAAGWAPLGPFPRALDFFGDGSLFIVDAEPGHVPGHVNALARTSADGGWVFLAGDAAHDRRLLTGEARIARHDVFGCAHRDARAAEEHIGRIRELMEREGRVRVILAHDVPWFGENEGGEAFWPGEIASL